MILWAPVFRRNRVNKLARVPHRLEVYAPVLGASTPLQTSTFSALAGGRQLFRDAVIQNTVRRTPVGTGIVAYASRVYLHTKSTPNRCRFRSSNIEPGTSNMRPPGSLCSFAYAPARKTEAATR